MSTPGTLKWETDSAGTRSAMAIIGGRPAVLHIVRRPHGTYQVVASVVIGSSVGHVTAHGANLLEEVAQAWLDRIGGRALGDEEGDSHK